MTSDINSPLESLGLGVARVATSTTDPAAIDVTFYGGIQAAPFSPRSIRKVYRSATAVHFPGEFKLLEADLQLSVARSSDYSFAISVQQGDALLAQGLGLIDRDDPTAILVAWWTGEVEPYGIVKYSIRDEHAVVGYYISKMTPNAPGEDIAIGDTRKGFRGEYVLNSQEVDGRTWGPHQWKLDSRGEVTDLTWWEHGRMFCRGVGMADPQDDTSIIATYIAL